VVAIVPGGDQKCTVVCGGSHYSASFGGVIMMIIILPYSSDVTKASTLKAKISEAKASPKATSEHK